MRGALAGEAGAVYAVGEAAQTVEYGNGQYTWSLMSSYVAQLASVVQVCPPYVGRRVRPGRRSPQAAAPARRACLLCGTPRQPGCAGPGRRSPRRGSSPSAAGKAGSCPTRCSTPTGRSSSISRAACLCCLRQNCGGSMPRSARPRIHRPAGRAPPDLLSALPLSR